MISRNDMLVTYIGLMAFFVILFFAIDFVSTSEHEQVHKQINTYFGCHNSTIELNFWGGSTRCLDANRSFTAQEWALHAENEIVSYNNASVTMTVFLCTMFILTFLFILFVTIFKEPYVKEPPPTIPPKK